MSLPASRILALSHDSRGREDAELQVDDPAALVSGTNHNVRLQKSATATYQ
jgi:hypothetical protein